MTQRQRSDPDALHYRPLHEAATLLRKRNISSVELTRSLLERIASLDGRLKSYATVMTDQALAAAERADQELAEGKYRGPLHGIPVAVKDLCFTKGTRTMGGTPVLADHVPREDATVVTRLADAGAVLLGKLNLTEGAMGGYHPDLSIPVNPWDPKVWTGASSSGSGVATAAGLAFATLGTDTLGSIRFPSAACGVVGLKPTWGRISRHGILPLAESLDHVGPMTRSTLDARLVFQAIAGHDARDPTSLREPWDDPLRLAADKIHDGMDQGVNGIHLGLDETYVSKDVEPEVASSVLSAVSVLEESGAKVTKVELPDLRGYLEAVLTICQAEAVVAHKANYPSAREGYGPWFRDWLDLGAEVTGTQLVEANHLRAAWKGQLREVFEGIDVLICPSMPTSPMPMTTDLLTGPMLPGPPSWYRFTAPFNLSSRPTLSLPCGLNDKGLPLSVQFVGPPLGEKLLFQIGHTYEEATEWHSLYPAIEGE